MTPPSLTKTKESMAKTVSNKIGCILIAVCLLFFTATLYRLWQQNNKFQVEVRQKVKMQSVNAAAEIREKLILVKQSVEQFKKQVEKDPNLRSIKRDIKDELQGNENIFSLSVAFKPYAYDRYTRYYAPYMERFSGELKEYNLVDYDKPFSEFNWFNRPKTEGAIWTEPYNERENDVLMTTYSVPFLSRADREKGETFSGVIPSDISLEFLTSSLKQLDLGLGGYGMIFSEQKRLISHPIFSFVQENKSYEELSKFEEFSFTKKIESCFTTDLQYAFFNGEVMTNDEHYAACVRIPDTGWTLITRMSSDMFEVDKTPLRQGYIQAIGWLSAALVVLLLILNDSATGTVSKRNMSLSVVLFTTALLIIVIARNYSADIKGDGMSISNFAQRAAFVDNYNQLSDQIRSKTPVFVSTGLFINSIEFVNAHNVHLTGNVWQKFKKQDLALADVGVNFPLAIKENIREIYKKQDDSQNLVVGYEFDVVLRHHFDYGKYPFDNKNIHLQIEHGEVGENVMLIPDLESYEKLGKRLTLHC
ncbi:MAG: hypothetical protein HWE10_01095 [Gammaproteobacteria bacterium]|nr:hypothetical protein [Gammaproteobacteria bacterium]